MTLVDRIRRRLRRASRGHELDYVFVVTYGRSGSTLVQGLLNTLPRVARAWGERPLRASALPRMCEGDGVPRATHRPPTPGGALGVLRAAERAATPIRPIGPRPGHRHPARARWPRQGGRARLQGGALERGPPEETEGFFDFLDSAFPGARYILNQRTHADVASSGFWQRRDTEEVFAALQRIEEIQAYLRESRPDRVLDTRYELITSDDSEAPVPSCAPWRSSCSGPATTPCVEKLRESMQTGYGPKAFGASHGRREQRDGVRPAPATAGDPANPSTALGPPDMVESEPRQEEWCRTRRATTTTSRQRCARPSNASRATTTPTTRPATRRRHTVPRWTGGATPKVHRRKAGGGGA